MAHEALKPCPFCGSKRVHFDKSWASSVILIYCPGCTAVVSFGNNKRDTFKKATEQWNQRAKDD